MKWIFMACFVLLTVCSGLMWSSMPEQTQRPTIYWTTDPNPARAEQIRLFGEWQVKNGYVDEEGNPVVDVVIDTGNRGRDKQIIQGVSGVAADVMDLFAANGDVQYLAQVGILEDVTDEAQELGYTVAETFPAVAPELQVRQADGTYRQFAFPCNVAQSQMFYVNKPVFRELGLEPPSGRWTIDEFERIGKAWVERANQGETGYNRRFFVDNIDTWTMMRSMGTDVLNETLTASTLDDPRVAEVLRRLRKWTYEDRLIPSGADRSAFTAGSGYGGSSALLFEEGRFALFKGGRYHLIRFRQANIDRVRRGLEPLELTLAEPPHGGFPVGQITTRCAAVYVDGDVKYAKLFQAFLASEEYNRQIVDDADALPPNPKYAAGPEFLRPTPNPERGIYPATEYEIHEAYLDSAKTIAVSPSHSPFVLTADVLRDYNMMSSRYMAEPMIGVSTPEEAMKQAAARTNERIARNVRDNPALQERYEKAVADQAEIDRLKAAGEPIPAHLIANPFHLAYYRSKGMLIEEPAADPAKPAAPTTQPTE